VKRKNLFKFRPQVFPFVWTENPHGETDQGPDMKGVVFPLIMLSYVMDLCVAVVTRGDAVIGAGAVDLFKFHPAVVSSGFRKSGLKKTAPAAAAIVVGTVGGHVDEIFLSYHRSHHIPKILRDGVSQAFSNQLAGILNGKGCLDILVPVRINLELSLPDPLGVVFYDAFNLELMLDLEFIQSDPD